MGVPKAGDCGSRQSTGPSQPCQCSVARPDLANFMPSRTEPRSFPSRGSRRMPWSIWRRRV